MTEDNKRLNGQNNLPDKADEELQEILRQVFGNKNKPRDVKADSGKEVKHDSNINTPRRVPPASRPVNRERTAAERPKRPVSGQERPVRRPNPENAKQGQPDRQRLNTQHNPQRRRPVNGQTTNRPRTADDQASKRSYPANGRQRPNSAKGPDGQRPTNGNRPVRRPADPKAAAAFAEKKVHSAENDRQSAKKPMPRKRPNALEKKISTLTGKKKAAVVASIIVGIILLLILAVYGIYHFYYSMFGKYSGKTNSGQYSYDSSDYTDDAHTLTPEEAEAALKKQLASKASGLMKDQDVMNILIIGEDLRDTESEERGNTDVMMMISLNQKKKTITMTSFLRDTWVNIDGYGTAKLNAAYWKDGPELLKSTIEDYYNVSIDRYVIVNFKSFMTIVDAVGGIDMDVSDDEAEGMIDPMAEQNNLLGNPKGTDYLKSGGKQLKLNGNQALAFARLRYVGNADYERTERQRRVIAEIINKSKDLSLVQIDKLLRKVLPEIKIDLTEGEIASLLLNCFDYMKYDIQELRIPADNMFTEEIIGTDLGNLAVLCPDFNENSRLLIKTIYGDDALTDSNQSDGTATQQNNIDNNTDNDYNNYNAGY